MVLTIVKFSVKVQNPSMDFLPDKDSAHAVITSHVKTMRKKQQESEININSSGF